MVPTTAILPPLFIGLKSYLWQVCGRIFGTTHLNSLKMYVNFMSTLYQLFIFAILILGGIIMAMFKNQEIKQMQKDMQKEIKKEQALEFYGFKNSSQDVQDKVYKILNTTLAGKTLLEVGSFLGGNTTHDTNKLIADYTKATVEQNWIIIKLLDELVQNKKDEE